jgi:FtsZ-binding cell division protein ZapB
MNKIMDIDDYINQLIRQIEELKNENDSLKLEVKTQRKEIAGLREERRMILNNDNPPGRCIRW